jgi:hypothetical protein
LKWLGIESHQARLLHVLEQDGSIFLGNIFPIGIMLPVLAKQVIEVALPLVAAKIKADPVLEGTLLGQSLRGRGALLQMEKSHFQTLIGSVPLLFLAFCCLLLALAVAFTLPSAVCIGWLVGGWLGSFGCPWPR